MCKGNVRQGPKVAKHGTEIKKTKMSLLSVSLVGLSSLRLLGELFTARCT